LVKTLAENHVAVGNRAYRGGAILSSTDCVVSINHSQLDNNKAEFGGCFHGNDMSLAVNDCVCQENLALGSGGCFYIESSNATFERNHVISNHASNKGGGIFMSEKTLLRVWNTSMVSNSAYFGGGIALFNGSRLLCITCLFENNAATEGGGVYIISNASQVLVGQMTTSMFRGNKASSYGGIDLVLL